MIATEYIRLHAYDYGLRPNRTYDVVVEHVQLHAYDYGLWPCVPTQLLWNTLNRTYDVAALFGAQAVKIGGFLRAGEG